MTNEDFLPQIPEGTVKIRAHYPQQGSHGRLGNWQPVLTEGKGLVDNFHLFPGLHLAHLRFMAPRIRYQHPASDMVIEINHCRRGRASGHLRNGQQLFLGAGDIDIHTTYACAYSLQEFPLGFYEGISISLDLNVFGRNLPAILQEARLSREQLYQDFCQPAGPLTVPGGSHLDRMLAPLYNIPARIRLPYYQIKIQEILLLLSVWKPDSNPGRQQYQTEQTGRIQEIHNFLTQNLENRYTIAQLSQKFNINPTTLKREFKHIYGQPLGKFMQEYRIREAMKRMTASDDSLSAIARQVGYASQSKFTKVFKEITGRLPTAYRRE